MSYLEDQDQWWLPGIFRDITVLSRPPGSVDDLWLRTDSAPDGTGSIDPEIIAGEQAYPIEIEIPELGVLRRFTNPASWQHSLSGRLSHGAQKSPALSGTSELCW
jgi:beta-galactosidase